MPNYAANISQSGDGTELVWTDTSTIVSPLTSRTLVVTDCNNVVLDQQTLGSHTTATFIISTDCWLLFTETIVDGSGTHIVKTSYLSTAFAEIEYANIVAAQGCSCDCRNSDQIEWATNLMLSAGIYAQLGNGVNANSNITAANTLLNGIATAFTISPNTLPPVPTIFSQQFTYQFG